MFKKGKKFSLPVQFDDTPQPILDLLQKEWDEGGAERMAKLLIKSVESDLYSTPEIAKLRNITRRAVSFAAKDANQRGKLWPIRNEKGEWVAPLIEWEKIFTEREKRRKR